MVKMLVGVYGSSGFGREVLPLVRSQLRNMEAEVVFVDDRVCSGQLNGSKVLSFNQFLGLRAAEKKVVFAISDGLSRAQLATKCKDHGISPFNVISSNSIILDEVSIGEGAILCNFTQLTSNIKIGIHFHANIYSYVAHDCVIGDFVTLAPSVCCNGNVVIEDHAYIGTGAVIKQGIVGKPLVIGKGAVVGMGAVVTKDVPPGVTVVGNPARVVVKN